MGMNMIAQGRPSAPALTLLNGALADTEFTSQATTRYRDYDGLTKTTVCLNVSLSGLSRTTTPKWDDILSPDEAKEAKISEVNLGVINVHKGLKDASGALRKELENIQRLMLREGEDWMTTLEMLPRVWGQLIELRDLTALQLRNSLLVEYDTSFAEYQRRINTFLAVSTWKLDDSKKALVERRLLQSFPSIMEVQSCLIVQIGKPVVIPGFQEQISEQQASILQTIQQYSREYNRNLQRNIREKAAIEAESIVAEMLGELTKWEPGYKPVHLKNKLDRHLQRIEVIRSAVSIAQEPLSNVLATLENALANIEGRQSQGEMVKIRQKLLGEQTALKASLDQVAGATSATLSALQL